MPKPRSPRREKHLFNPYDPNKTKRDLVNFIKLRADPGELKGTIDANTPLDVLQTMAAKLAIPERKYLIVRLHALRHGLTQIFFVGTQGNQLLIVIRLLHPQATRLISQRIPRVVISRLSKMVRVSRYLSMLNPKKQENLGDLRQWTKSG
jgi:hypothetical protein